MDVELGRVQAERLLQTATVRATFEALVQRESAVALPVRDMATTVEQRTDVREAAARTDAAVAKLDRALLEGRFDATISPVDAGISLRSLTVPRQLRVGRLYRAAGRRDGSLIMEYYRARFIRTMSA